MDTLCLRCGIASKYQALNAVQEETQLQNDVIFTDSMESLQLISSPTGIYQHMVDITRSLIYHLKQRMLVLPHWIKPHLKVYIML